MKILAVLFLFLFACTQEPISVTQVGVLETKSVQTDPKIKMKLIADSLGTNNFILYYYDGLIRLTNETLSNKTTGVVSYIDYSYDEKDRVVNRGTSYANNHDSDVRSEYVYEVIDAKTTKIKEIIHDKDALPTGDVFITEVKEQLVQE